MLGPDLLPARRQGEALVVKALKGQARERALELANQLLLVTAEHVGSSREQWAKALSASPRAASERKLALGLCKLIEQGLTFEAPARIEPVALRQVVFELATEQRLALAPGAEFDRDRVLAEAATSFDVPVVDVEASLFADLVQEQRITAHEALTSEALLRRYDEASVQGVLLRATRVVVDFRCRSAAEYRDLFMKLKFRRLLYELERTATGYRLTIDGPLSLFDSVTKYGLQLALIWPSLRACPALRMEASVRWGKQRQPLTFVVEQRPQRGAEAASPAGPPSPELPEELAGLVAAVERLEPDWGASASDALLELPGLGICIPDLVFVHRPSGWVGYFERLGYWSRDAVWRRVELARSGLGAPVLFAASRRLRVSESVLEGEESAALYVFKGKLNARAVLRKLEQLRLGQV